MDSVMHGLIFPTRERLWEPSFQRIVGLGHARCGDLFDEHLGHQVGAYVGGTVGRTPPGTRIEVSRTGDVFQGQAGMASR